MNDDKVYVLCVYEHMEHTTDSLLTKCVECGVNLYIQPYHLEEKRNPICMDCVKMEMPDVEMRVDNRDIAKAFKEIKKRWN